MRRAWIPPRESDRRGSTHYLLLDAATGADVAPATTAPGAASGAAPFALPGDRVRLQTRAVDGPPEAEISVHWDDRIGTYPDGAFYSLRIPPQVAGPGLLGVERSADMAGRPRISIWSTALPAHCSTTAVSPTRSPRPARLPRSPTPMSRPGPDCSVRWAAPVSQVGCAGCHTPSQRTDDFSIPEFAYLTIYPLTDLLLHDLGLNGERRRCGGLDCWSWSTASSHCCTTVVPATSRKQSFGTVAKPGPPPISSVTSQRVTASS